MRSGDLRIKLVCHATGIAGLLKRWSDLGKAVFLQEGFTETRVSKSVVLIQPECSLEHLNRAIYVLSAIVILEIADALKVVVVCIGDLGAIRSLFGSLGETRVHAKHFKGCADDCVFDVEGIVGGESQAVCAELPASARFDEDEVEAHLPAGSV